MPTHATLVLNRIHQNDITQTYVSEDWYSVREE